MGIAKAFFKTKDFFPNYREPKVSWLDRARMDRANCNLMDAIALYLDKRVRLRVD